jgi:YHS domain-containing protein
MVRLISLFILAFAIYLVLKTVLGFVYFYRKKKEGDRRAQERLGGDMAEDPICHTYVPKATALKQSVDGQTIYFCGTQCAEAFFAKAKG